MKICPICKIEKNINEFYKTSPYCKLCSKEFNKKYRNKHRAEVTAYKKKYRKLYKKEIAVMKKTYNKNNPEKVKAHGILNRAVKKGEIIKQPCSICKKPKAEAHHPNYNYPLDVIWLCSIHHKAIHKEGR